MSGVLVRGVTGFLAGAVSVLRSHDRELACRRCRCLVATVRMRPLSMIDVRTPEGEPISPLGGALMMRILHARLTDATTDGDAYEVLHIEQQIEDLRAAAGEVIYDLPCRCGCGCGARYVRSLPQLSHLTRRPPAGRVEL